MSTPNPRVHARSSYFFTAARNTAQNPCATSTQAGGGWQPWRDRCGGSRTGMACRSSCCSIEYVAGTTRRIHHRFRTRAGRWPNSRNATPICQSSWWDIRWVDARPVVWAIRPTCLALSAWLRGCQKVSRWGHCLGGTSACCTGLVTGGRPHTGVATSSSVVGRSHDLHRGSHFRGPGTSCSAARRRGDGSWKNRS